MESILFYTDNDEQFYGETSRLSKRLEETLSDKRSLAHFSEYMESISSQALVEFWVEVENFKVAVCFLSDEAIDDPAREVVEGTTRTESTLADVTRSQHNGSDEDRIESLNLELKSSNVRSSKVNLPSIDEDVCSDPNNLKKKILNSAIGIFKKFIALESPNRLDIPDDVRNAIVSSICHPEGLIERDIFQVVQKLVFNRINNQYFENYLQSVYHCKYQIDILTSGSLTIEDIIYNQMALFYFMEYLEQEQCSPLLEFVMAVVNYKEHLKTNVNYDPEQAQNDAIILYDKYFSLQATNSLGFSSDIRFYVEENICRDGGPAPDCFHRPFRLVLNKLKQYIVTFLTSQLYYKYLSEMIGSVQSDWQTTKKHKKSASDCSSDMSTSTRNTLLAMGDMPKCNGSTSSMRIDSKQLYNGDMLWRRKSDKGLCLGRVNSLGRFESTMEPDPEKKDPSVIKRVVSKLVYGEKDKAKEELAWQVAHMIVKDITDVTMGSPDGQL